MKRNKNGVPLRRIVEHRLCCHSSGFFDRAVRKYNLNGFYTHPFPQNPAENPADLVITAFALLNFVQIAIFAASHHDTHSSCP